MLVMQRILSQKLRWWLRLFIFAWQIQTLPVLCWQFCLKPSSALILPDYHHPLAQVFCQLLGPYSLALHRRQVGDCKHWVYFKIRDHLPEVLLQVSSRTMSQRRIWLLWTVHFNLIPCLASICNLARFLRLAVWWQSIGSRMFFS